MTSGTPPHLTDFDRAKRRRAQRQATGPAVEKPAATAKREQLKKQRISNSVMPEPFRGQKNATPPLTPPKGGYGFLASVPNRPLKSALVPNRLRRSPGRGGVVPLSEPVPLAERLRLMLVWVVLLLGGLGLGLKLFQLQVIKASDLGGRAKRQQEVAPTKLMPQRPIVDRRGNVLAIDRPVYTLYAHPMMFKLPAGEIAKSLAPILQRSETELIKEFATRDTGIFIADSLGPEVKERIVDLGLDGLDLEEHYGRLYPYEDLAAEVVGYVDLQGQPQAGLEYTQHSLLNRSIPPHSGGFVPMDDLRLQISLDSRLQQAAREALKAKMKEFKAKRGTVIVMDAQDGSLLSLVTEPTYNPNEYFKFDTGRFKNWALADTYEPGSTFKPLVVAIGLENGTIKPDSVFNDGGQIYVDGWPINNASGGGHGAISITDILKYSSNVGMVQVAATMKREVFYKWLERLGLGDNVKTDLPFSAKSQIKSFEEFTGSQISAATTAFGQGVTVTPLQLVQLYGALANGGKLVTPHLVQGLFDSQGKSYWQPQLPEQEQIFSPQTSQAVVGMLEHVVSEADGTGKAAQIPGYRVAGKTGTAQKASSGGGYSDYAKIVSFASIVPVDSPRYVVLAVVDEPVGGSGGMVGAPVVKSVIEALIAIEGLAPSLPEAEGLSEPAR